MSLLFENNIRRNEQEFTSSNTAFPSYIQAVELLGDLHDALEEGGCSGYELERFLVRVLFCLFADDTGIFERNAFSLYIENHSKADGSDLGGQIANFFETLDKEPALRQRNLDEELAALPHVNGTLFKERLGFAAFNRAMRERLLRCSRFDWSRISPAIFGAVFQGVMEPKERRQEGAHYTSERDIMKLVGSLFLDDLRAEFEKIKSNKNKLKEFHKRLGRLRFFDPACGCGNFLVVTYRELRLLELDVLTALNGQQKFMDIHSLALVDVDTMIGIEINEFPARIAEVALWLIDYQMNQLLSAAYGQYFVQLPLRKSAKIVHGNALKLNWKEVLPPENCSFILGNPPFVGGKYLTAEQRADMALITHGIKNAGLLDYVTAWYFKAAEYIQGTAISVAFVSTNSLTQGEQVGVLWGELFRRGVRIRFGHRTFAWESEARGKAHVHVVILGFGLSDAVNKRIYETSDDSDHPSSIDVANISPYLVEGPNTVIVNRSKPLCDVPEIGIGNKPIDDGNYLFLPDEKKAFLKLEPAAKKYFRRWLGADEFINGWERWCLWLGDCSQAELRTMPEVMKRVTAVQEFRLASHSIPTQKLAESPTQFHVEHIPTTRFLVIPRVSSKERKWIPLGYMKPATLVSDSCLILPNAKLFHFGILTSTMHMAWVKQIGGRLKSDFRYSSKLIYNNFPWPQDITEKERALVEEKAQGVLNIRDEFPNASLADLYDRLVMPAKLLRAHKELDKAVDKCYRSKSFQSDHERVSYLFTLYEKLTSPLIR